MENGLLSIITAGQPPKDGGFLPNISCIVKCLCEVLLKFVLGTS